MSVVSSRSGQKSWRNLAEVVSLLDAMAERDEDHRLGTRLEDLRRSQGLTQEQAAQKVGVTVRQWQRLETGDSDPRAGTLAKIAGAFGISINELIGLRGSESQMDRIEGKLDDLVDRLVLAGVLQAVDQDENQAQRPPDEERPPEAA